MSKSGSLMVPRSVRSKRQDNQLCKSDVEIQRFRKKLAEEARSQTEALQTIQKVIPGTKSHIEDATQKAVPRTKSHIEDAKKLVPGTKSHIEDATQKVVPGTKSHIEDATQKVVQGTKSHIGDATQKVVQGTKSHIEAASQKVIAGTKSQEVEGTKTKSTCDVVHDVLTDLVNKTCQVDKETFLVKTNMKCSSFVPTPCSVSLAINLQPGVEFVDTGPISYSKKVPVFKRKRQPANNEENLGHNYYSGLCYRPSSNASGYPSHSRSETQDYYPRQWEYTDVGKYYLRRPKNHRGFEFTVMSYNVLAQNLLEDHYNMYMNTPPEFLDWNYRRYCLMKELIYHSPDVICLQEVNFDHYEDFFLPKLKERGYDGAYMKRTGNKLDGCATFFKKHKFTCEQVILVPFSNDRGGALLDRDNVALIVKLKPSSRSVPTHKSLVVANTHLIFNPRRGDIKLAQLMILLAEVDKCAYLGMYPDKYQPVILCGDFNSEPHSELYKLLIMGYLEYEGLFTHEISGQEEGRYGRKCASLRRNFFPRELGITDRCQYCEVIRARSRRQSSSFMTSDVPDDDDDVIVVESQGVANYSSQNDLEVTYTQGSGCLQQELQLVSVYEHWLSRLWYRHREITTHHSKAACTVDYILYGVRSGQVRFYQGEVQTRNIEEGHLNLLARYGLLSDRELRNMGSLPNDLYGSDHLAVMARFLLT